MITGDHLRTALSVAHAAAMLLPQQPTLLLDVHPPHQLQGRLLQPDGTATTLPPAALQSALGESNATPIAVTGPAWQALGAGGDEGVRWRVAMRGVVFARMAPEDKRGVVEVLSQGGLGSSVRCWRVAAVDRAH